MNVFQVSIPILVTPLFILVSISERNFCCCVCQSACKTLFNSDLIFFSWHIEFVAPEDFSFQLGFSYSRIPPGSILSPTVICICSLSMSKHQSSSNSVLAHPFQWHSAPADLGEKLDALHNILHGIQLWRSSLLKKHGIGRRVISY